MMGKEKEKEKEKEERKKKTCGGQLCLNPALPLSFSTMSAKRIPLGQIELSFLPLATKRLLNNTVLQAQVNTAVLLLDNELESEIF